jgi:hypothetical protein
MDPLQSGGHACPCLVVKGMREATSLFFREPEVVVEAYCPIISRYFKQCSMQQSGVLWGALCFNITTIRQESDFTDFFETLRRAKMESRL